jgi:hypothetical protein
VDQSGSYVLAAVSESEAGGGIFLVSSVYLTSYDAITTNEYGNRDLIFLMLEHVSDASAPMGCSYVMFSPTTLEDLTMREARWWCALVAVIAPLGVAAAGVVTLVRRRNR